MKLSGVAVVAVAGAVLAGCGANFASINRSTLFDGFHSTTTTENGKLVTVVESDGKVIHLDAQQRTIIVAGLRYCAEPSPDAIASLAASAGLSASVPGTGAGAASGALSTAVASIGLRTQSIQLMRDSLYRLCESANNKQINKADMAMLLRRSQDLTAVVVAVEQLTGAVAANQALLAGGASAQATAALVNNQQALQALEQQVASLEQEVAAAEQSVTAAEKAQKDAEDAEKAQRDIVKDPARNTDDAQRQANADELKRLTAIREDKDRDLATAKARRNERQRALTETKAVRDQVKAERDSALATSRANAETQSSFSQAAQTIKLDEKASEAIAKEVRTMVLAVLEKQYSVQHCMTYLTGAADPKDKIIAICQAIMLAAAKQELGTEFFGTDTESRKVRCLLDEDKAKWRKEIVAFLKYKGRDDVRVVHFRLRDSTAQLRTEFVKSRSKGESACLA